MLLTKEARYGTVRDTALACRRFGLMVASFQSGCTWQVCRPKPDACIHWNTWTFGNHNCGLLQGVSRPAVSDAVAFGCSEPKLAVAAIREILLQGIKPAWVLVVLRAQVVREVEAGLSSRWKVPDVMSAMGCPLSEKRLSLLV